MSTSKRIFDCCMFGGEMDTLSIRLHELDAVVDCFVIVESNETLSGAPRDISFSPRDPRISKFAAKVRHVAVTDMPPNADHRAREKWQRNAALRGIPDAREADLVVLSDVDEIPRAAVLAQMAADCENEVFGVRLARRYLYVNCCNVALPKSAQLQTAAASRRTLNEISPDELRYGVRDGHIRARIFECGGWHFSHLKSQIGVGQRTAAGFHQNIRGATFLHRKLGSQLNVLRNPDLPEWLLRNRWRLGHLFYAAGAADRVRTAFSSLPALLPKPSKPALPPVVICPYLYDHEAEEVRSKFGIEERRTRTVEFYLWQDKGRIGPERAFEYCWDQFPDRDIIIIHSDMAPMPGEPLMRWYDALMSYRDDLPEAGMIACNLYYPIDAADGPVSLQCAGGIFSDGRIGHLHGGLDEPGGVSSATVSRIRPVEWVTFGGVLIRREVIRACGPFDRRYEWAYVMDVDYSFEARLRGFRLMQVPVSLQHEENRTTRSLWQQRPELLDHMTQNFGRFYAKWKSFYPLLLFDQPKL